MICIKILNTPNSSDEGGNIKSLQTNIYISIQMLVQKALEDLNDIYP